MTTDEKLIESVKKYPCLWNTQLSTYKCNETKDAAWELVATETNIKGIQNAKNKWKKLRDGYRDALKRHNSVRSGQAMKQIRPWKYQHIMEFLLPHMSNRNRTSNFTADPEEHDNNTRMSANSSTQNDSSNLDFLEEQLSQLEDLRTESINDNNCTESENQQSSTQDLPSNTSLPSTSRTNKRKASFSEFLQIHQQNHEQLMKERAEIKEILKAPDTTDEIDHFFLGMAKSLKKLPAYLQRQVKRKAMTALMEAEEIHEQNQQIIWPNTSYGYSTAPNSEPVPTSTNNQTSAVLQSNAESQNKEPAPPGTDEE